MFSLLAAMQAYSPGVNVVLHIDRLAVIQQQLSRSFPPLPRNTLDCEFFRFSKWH